LYSYADNNPLNGNDPLGLDTNCMGGSCVFSAGGIKTTPFPRPSGYPDKINSTSSDYHFLPNKVLVNNGRLSLEQLNAGLTNQPTPGMSNNAATRQGAYNNASPGGFPGFVLAPGRPWPVMSYVVNDVATGSPVILNVTLPGHPLFPGTVARFVSGSIGNYTVNNVGEGTAGIENGESRIAEFIFNDIWKKQTNTILQKLSVKRSESVKYGPSLNSESIPSSGSATIVELPSTTQTNTAKIVYKKEK
jgi:hypothetical protein